MNDLTTHTIYVGFAYSLNEDGSFGGYNEDIAKCMLDSWHEEKGKPIWVGIQWEIYDALMSLNPKFVSWHVPVEHVAAPPLFREEDLKVDGRVHKIRDMLDTICSTDPRKPILEYLRDEIVKEVDQMPPQRASGIPAGLERIQHPDQLAALLDRIIVKGGFLDTVIGANEELGLSFDYVKTKDCVEWLEKRRLPTASDGLGDFQRRRLSRVMLDFLFAEKLGDDIKSKYLNTVQVCRKIFDRVETENIEFDHVKIFGFPEHSPRCTSAALQTLWIDGRQAEIAEVPIAGAISVTDVNNPSGTVDRVENPNRRLDRAGNLDSFPWKWYSNTAQTWCQSLEKWKMHEGRTRSADAV